MPAAWGHRAGGWRATRPGWTRGHTTLEGVVEMCDRWGREQQAMNLTIHHGDNLDTLRALVERGERFDLVELDGPYGAGLEAWDCLSEAEYVEHYAARLELVRRVLQPWGVVYLFGYPEMVALVRAWAQQTGTLHLRRWLNWYKQVTAHKGRKVEAIGIFLRDTPSAAAAAAFGAELRRRRIERGWTLADVGERAGRAWWHRGGNLYYETGSGGFPSREDFDVLCRMFDINPEDWPNVAAAACYSDVTDLDYIGTHYPESTRDLNDAGLRSKPVGLYLDLFRPVVPPRPDKRALILYGGSGNAAIAAGRLGYRVDVCETDAGRCERLQRNYAWGVERRDETPVEELGPLFNQEAA
jgi:transcriptional regulator with XRE-family HTH domain